MGQDGGGGDGDREEEGSPAGREDGEAVYGTNTGCAPLHARRGYAPSFDTSSGPVQPQSATHSGSEAPHTATHPSPTSRTSP